MTITSFLTAHWGTILVVGAYVVLAFVNNLPKPGTTITPYEYIYNVVQSLLNNPVVHNFQQKYSAPAPKTLAEINQLKEK